MDEFALHPDPRRLYAIASPGITWGGQLEIVSTHRGVNNFFNALCREAEGENRARWSHHRVTLDDALEQGFLSRLQATLPPDAAVQDMDEAAYRDHVRATCPDDETWQQEYLCQPEDDASKFLPYDLISACEYPPGHPWRETEGGLLYAGIDIGREHDLTVLWVVERLGDVICTRHVEAMSRMRKSEQEAVIDPWIARCQRTCIDRTGLGIGWVDDAQDRHGHRVEGVTFTGTVKEALAYSLRGALEDRKVRIPHDRAVSADLRALRKTTTAAGNVRFDAPRTSDGHADRAWALALALEAASDASGPFTARYGARSPTADLYRSTRGWQDEMDAGYLH